MNSKLPVTVDVVDTRSLSREKLYNTSNVSSTSLQESRLSTVVSWINIRSIGQKKLITSTLLFKEAHKPGGVLLGSLGGGLPPGSSNSDPISDQKNVIFRTRFQIWPLGRIHVIIIRLESKQKNYQNH